MSVKILHYNSASRRVCWSMVLNIQFTEWITTTTVATSSSGKRLVVQIYLDVEATYWRLESMATVLDNRRSKEDTVGNINIESCSVDTPEIESSALNWRPLLVEGRRIRATHEQLTVPDLSLRRGPREGIYQAIYAQADIPMNCSILNHTPTTRLVLGLLLWPSGQLDISWNLGLSDNERSS